MVWVGKLVLASQSHASAQCATLHTTHVRAPARLHKLEELTCHKPQLAEPMSCLCLLRSSVHMQTAAKNNAPIPPSHELRVAGKPANSVHT
eukprot:5572742-Amphidinium_carterae.1